MATLNRTDRRQTERAMRPHMVGNTKPEQARAYMENVFAMNIERAAAKQLLRDTLAQGLTAEMRSKIETFLEKHPDS